MAKKLTKGAIKFIIEMYDSEDTNYTFPEIANLVADKFGIEISGNAVHKSYHKNKDSFSKSSNPGTDKFEDSKSKNPVKDSKVNSPKRLNKVLDNNLEIRPTNGFQEGNHLSKSELKNLLD